jgi:molecular chaperone DnaK (HSP70)
MKLGIDFGTTRIAVAAADRGNYPVIRFEDLDGVSREWFPPLIAARGEQRLYGWQAWAAQSYPGWTVLRSIKRVLEDAGPYSDVEIAGARVGVVKVLCEMVSSLNRALVENSSLPAYGSEGFEVMLGVPANANSNQRFLTVEAFQRTGFNVLGLLNEPSAASIEYAHRNGSGRELEQVLVYDFGGGTFDASLVQIDDRTHTIVGTEGVRDLGGDDFDEVLAQMALEHAGLEEGELTQSELFLLHDECRAKKESLNANSRRVVVDLSLVRPEWGPVSIPTNDYYDRCRPLVARSIQATEHLLASAEEDHRLDALYVTGGGSELPLVSRMLREVFGRRVKRSAYTRSATAIGLAIQADSQLGYVLQETFGRYFGVWRESEGGKNVIFDPLFPKGTPLPAPGEAPVTITRRYHPVHNVGHFRFLESSAVDDFGRPIGDLTLWDEVYFPFDPTLVDEVHLGSVDVKHTGQTQDQWIEERYAVDATGGLEVRIANSTANYSREYRLGRWSPSPEPIVTRKRRVKAAR